jgi:hypothetical protein
VQSQACLADPTDARQGDDPSLIHNSSDARRIRLAPQERRNLNRQIPGHATNRSQRRESRLQARRGHLEHTLREGEIPQPLLTEIHEHHTLGQHLTRQIGGCLRTHDLASMRDGLQPSRTVDRRTEVIAVAELPHPCVDPNPCPQRLAHRPPLRVHRSLAVDRRAHRGIRGGKHSVDAVAAALHHLTAVRGDPVTQDHVVSGQGRPHRLRLLIPQPGRDLEIREQERHRPRR